MWNLDKYLREIASPLYDDPKIFKFDPYQYESLLADVSSSLDRCLVYRREFNDLVASAVRQAMEYQTFNELKNANETLEAAPWILDLKNLDAQGQGVIADKFGAGTQTSLTRGFAASSKSARDVSLLGVDAERGRQDLVKKRWTQMSKFQDDLMARHETPGHPLNFGERSARVRNFLTDDFLDAIIKALTVREGLKAVYNFDLDKEWLKSQQPLDDFVKWTRKAVRMLEAKSHFETLINGMFIISNPVVAKWTPCGRLVRFIYGDQNQRLHNARLRGLSAHLWLRDDSIHDSHLLRGVVALRVEGRAAFLVPEVTILPPLGPSQYRSDRLLANAPLDGNKIYYWFEGVNHPHKNIAVSYQNVLSLVVDVLAVGRVEEP